jgi:hypothetical protein
LSVFAEAAVPDVSAIANVAAPTVAAAVAAAMAVAVYRRDLRMSTDAPFAAIGGSRNESRWPGGQRAAATSVRRGGSVHILRARLTDWQDALGSYVSTLRYETDALYAIWTMQ